MTAVSDETSFVTFVRESADFESGDKGWFKVSVFSLCATCHNVTSSLFHFCSSLRDRNYNLHDPADDGIIAHQNPIPFLETLSLQSSIAETDFRPPILDHIHFPLLLAAQPIGLYQPGSSPPSNQFPLHKVHHPQQPTDPPLSLLPSTDILALRLLHPVHSLIVPTSSSLL